MSMSLEEMKNIDVRTVDPETLVDATKIVIDESLPKEERVKEYLRQVKKRFCIRANGISFTERRQRNAETARLPEQLRGALYWKLL